MGEPDRLGNLTATITVTGSDYGIRHRRDERRVRLGNGTRPRGMSADRDHAAHACVTLRDHG